MARDLFSNVSDQRKRGSPVKDSATGKVYPSRNKAYQALAPQLELDPSDQYGWYTLCQKFPYRFIDFGTGRPIDIRGSLSRTEIHIGPQGRVVIPAAARHALALQPGDTLIAREEGGRLVLEKRASFLARVKERFAKVPRDVSLVKDLSSERRSETRREGEQ